MGAIIVHKRPDVLAYLVMHMLLAKSQDLPLAYHFFRRRRSLSLAADIASLIDLLRIVRQNLFNVNTVD
jgi:hypothetical protein